ncbi:MAG: asparagine synthase (glutamine-hydrolyzing), partial [Planctomycetota bacterium]
MCGIAGFVGSRDPDLLRRMVGALRHRGPDAEGVWCDAEAGVHLGHARLAIIDLADGAQPMWTADDDLGVVFNGEIYNHQELRRELEQAGHTFRTDHSDTEVLLHGYREWGAELPKRLNGMWAFALYDRRERRLFLSRDRCGQKPLYYYSQAGTFVFASEASALRQHPAVAAEWSPLALRKYFAYGWAPAPATLYADIRMLPGGCNLTLDLEAMTPRTTTYWQFEVAPWEPGAGPDPAAAAEELRRLLRQAVRRRLMADVPVGVFLSGGIDSTAVTALACEAAPDVQSFSIGFEEPSFDESAEARRAATLLGVKHHSTTLSMARARELLPAIVDRLDHPFGDSSLLPTYLLCGEARRQVTVALGGDGADELLAGYDPFRALGPARLYHRCLPGPLRRGVRWMANRLPVSHRNMSFDFRLKRTLRGLAFPPGAWLPAWIGPLAATETDALFGGSRLPPEELYAEALSLWERCPAADDISRTVEFYVRLYLQNDILVKVDRASMMHSLEVRSPFLDRDLVDFVRRLPPDYRYRRQCTKFL